LAPASRIATFARYWLPVLAYVALIFTLSSMPHLRPPFGFLNSDKVIHMGEYLVLGWLLGRGLRTVPRFGSLLAGGLLAISLGAAVGCADELYQAYVPGRDSSALDWTADFLGLTLSQIGYAWLKRPAALERAPRRAGKD
jgi:VanZ family protein